MALHLVARLHSPERAAAVRRDDPVRPAAAGLITRPRAVGEVRARRLVGRRPTPSSSERSSSMNRAAERRVDPRELDAELVDALVVDAERVAGCDVPDEAPAARRLDVLRDASRPPARCTHGRLPRSRRSWPTVLTSNANRPPSAGAPAARSNSARQSRSAARWLTVSKTQITTSKRSPRSNAVMSASTKRASGSLARARASICGERRGRSASRPRGSPARTAPVPQPSSSSERARRSWRAM